MTAPIRFPPLKTMFFDVGNVLVFYDFRIMVRKLAVCLGTLEGDIAQIFLYNGLGTAYECGEISSTEVRKRLRARATRHPSDEELHTAMTDIFEINTEIFPLIEELKQKNVRLVVLSNIGEAHYQFLRDRHNIFSHFDDLVLSFRVGAMKPHSDIYRHALSVADCEPEHCFFVDDLGKNVKAAREHGIPSEVFHGVSQLRDQLAQRKF